MAAVAAASDGEQRSSDRSPRGVLVPIRHQLSRAGEKDTSRAAEKGATGRWVFSWFCPVFPCGLLGLDFAAGFTRFALVEPVAFAIHFKNVDMVS